MNYKEELQTRGIINLESQTDLSGFYVIYEGSTLLEEVGTRGVSHLAEHLVCGLYDDLQDEFDENSISWNAYTSSTHIVFFITGLDEYLTQFKDKIINSILTLDIKEERFIHEKKIVIEELLDCFSDQSTSHGLNLNRKLFGDYSAIGVQQDLENITYDDFMTFVRRQFTKPKSIINVSKYTPYKNDSIEFSNDVFDKEIHYVEDIKNDLNDLMIINEYAGKSSIINISKTSVSQEDFPYVLYINSMLASGLNSPLYQELREKRGLCYGVGCTLDDFTLQNGFVNIYASTSNEKVEEFQETVKMVLDNPREYLTQKRFDIIMKSLSIGIKKSEINRFSNINKYIKPYKLIQNIMDDLTLEDLFVVYEKYYNFDNWYLSIDTDEFKQ